MSAAALFGLSALAAGIESANIVGYTTTNCAAGKWYLVGSQFTTTTNTSISIQDFIKGMTSSDDAGAAPRILVSNGSGYTTYYYLTTAYDDDLNEYTDKWADDGQTVVTTNFAPGTVVWFKSPVDCTITTSGQVINNDSYTITAPANQFTLIANPYPINLLLNSSKITWNLVSSDDAGSAPRVLIYNGTGYTTYYYLTTAYDADLNEYSNKWADDGQTVADITIPTGTGIWIKPTTNVTITFAK